MKNLADFKKKLRVGINLHCIFHQDFAGRDENGNILYKDKDKGVREVGIVQSNAFTLKTTQTDGKIIDSWCHYPKASEVRILSENSILINEEYKGKMTPILTYTFV